MSEKTKLVLIERRVPEPEPGACIRRAVTAWLIHQLDAEKSGVTAPASKG